MKGKESSDDEEVQPAEVLAATNAVFLRPNQPSTWANLAQVGDCAYAAEVAKSVAEAGDHDSTTVAKALAGVGSIACDQKAIMIAPWIKQGWEGLKQDVAAASA